MKKHVAKVRVLVDFANKTTKKICFLTRFNTFVLFVKDEDFFIYLYFVFFTYKTVYLLPLLQKDKNEWFQ
jgi:hypothetical protein